jgi:hypothetical protein
MGLVSADWGRTVDVRNRMSGNPAYEEPDGETRVGRYMGYPIIARDTPINGGVYLGAGAREALVVDDRNQPELLEVWKAMLPTAPRSGTDAEERFLAAITQTVDSYLPYPKVSNPEAVIAGIVAESYGPQAVSGDVLVPESLFIQKRIGICRQKALLDGYLVERAIRAGYLDRRSKVSIDRNSVPGIGGHAWRRYKNPNGVVFIGDSATGYYGRLENAPKTWPYDRPGIRDKLRHLRI